MPQPLYLRLYFKKHLTDLVRLVGYDGLPLEGFRERLQPLVEAHGEGAIRDACEEILRVDETQTPLCARLTEHVRQLAVGILGRPGGMTKATSIAKTSAGGTAPPGKPRKESTSRPAKGHPAGKRPPKKGK